MQTQESLGKRLGRFMVMMGTIFFITIAVLISERLSSDSLALLLGLSCGVGTMIPTLLLGVWVWRREENRRRQHEQARRQAGGSMPTSPPLVVVAPQALPAYTQQPVLPQYQAQTLAWNATETTKRNFTIVGGEE